MEKILKYFPNITPEQKRQLGHTPLVSAMSRPFN